METIHIPVEPDFGAGSWRGVEDLLVRAPRAIHSTPHAVSYFDESARVRRTFNGPELPGPYAFLVQRLTPCDPMPKVHMVKDGSLVEIEGHIFEINITDDLVELNLAHASAGANL